MQAVDVNRAMPELAALQGQPLGASEWKVIDQAMVDEFSALTGDAGPIHNDPVQAAKVSPFGGTIIQGSLMLSHLAGFAKSLGLPQDQALFRLNYGFDRVRIISPVPVGLAIRGTFVMKDLIGRPGNAVMMVTEAKVEAEGLEKPAVVADWLVYFQLGPDTPLEQAPS